MKHKKQKSLLAGRQGFTLLELLIVIFIIGLISSILVVNWRKNEKQYQLQRAAQQIVQNIRKAQDMALNSFKYQDDVPDTYGLWFKKDDKDSYIIFGDINRNNKYEGVPPDIKVEDVSIESNIEIHSLSSGIQDLHINFSLPDGFTLIEPSAGSASITIKRSDTTCPSKDCKTIKVLSTGQVNIE